MKRNQFYSTVIRLLVEAMFFYVLGAYVANYKFETSELFVDVEEVVVNPSNLDDSNFIADIVRLLDNVGIYTQKISLRPVMNSQYICLNQETRRKIHTPIRRDIERTHGTEHLLDKPPRGDEIDDDTS